jgi:peptidoglycan/LPS O-acetylase OafA/YrhL
MARRLESLQALRAVAALAVMMGHSDLVLTAAGDQPHAAADFGTLGVDVFFVLSGFVMATVASRAAGSVDAIAFLVKRAGRILPLYWLVLAAQCACLSMAGRPPAADEMLSAAMMLPDFTHGTLTQPVVMVGWSLFVEVWFYLVTAAAIWLMKPGAPRTAVVSGVVLSLALLAAATNHTPTEGGWLGYYGMSVVVEFPLGWLLAVFADRIRVRSVPVALFAAVAGTALLASGAIGGAGDWSTVSMRGWSAAPIGAALLVWAAVQLADAVDWRRGGWRLMASLGDASYSIYLLHVLVLEFIGSALPPLKDAMGHDVGEAVWVAASCGVVVLMSCASYRLIESPLNRAVSGMADRWLYRCQHLHS